MVADAEIVRERSARVRRYVADLDQYLAAIELYLDPCRSDSK